MLSYCQNNINTNEIIVTTSGGTIPKNHESIIEPLVEMRIDHRDIVLLQHQLSPIRNRTIIDASSAFMAVLGIYDDRLIC